MNKEIRATSEVAIKDDRRIEGYAVVFNARSQMLCEQGRWFYEYIDESAINNDVLNRSDVKFLYNHDANRGILARWVGGDEMSSLSLSIDEHGLKFSFEAPKTALGDELLEGIRRHDIRGCSFGMIIEADKWSKNEDGEYIRHITAIRQLFDASAVINPAYQATEINTRSLDKYIESENEQNIDDKYYNNLIDKIYE